jgi:hypothetical protein
MMEDRILGCFALPALFFTVLGLVLGITSLIVIRRSGGRLKGVGRARFSILLSLCALGVLTFMLAAFKSDRRPEKRDSSLATHFGAFSVVESKQPPAHWFDGGGIGGVASGEIGPDRVVADDSDLLREWVKKAGFRDTAARHIAAVSIRHHQEKGTDVEMHIWFADVDTQSNPADVMAMRHPFPGEVTMQSGRFLMGIFTLQHPRGGELMERLVRYYSDEITRVERGLNR